MNNTIIQEYARKIGFESVMFNTEFKHSTREQMRHYLWLKEFELWLNKNHNVIIQENITDVMILEQTIINTINQLNS